jgi:hypothetical protein
MALDYQAQAKQKQRQSEFVDFAYKGGYDIANPKEMDKAMAAFEAVETRFGKGTATGAPPAAQAAATPQAVPKDKSQLVSGQSYTLSDGRVGKWNGTAFSVIPGAK